MKYAFTMQKLGSGVRGLGAVMAAALVLWLSPVRADDASDRARVQALLDQLATAPDAATADGLTQQIWRIWIVPADADLAGRMAAVLTDEQAGDLATARQLLDAMVMTYPTYAEGWNQRATIEYETQDYAASRADIDQVLKLEPRHFGALSGLVMVDLALGDRKAALTAMLAALRVHPFLGEKALFPELNQPETRT